ncbi:MAG: class I SAM-dependent methyltransferase [Candidatus Aureabacteria bacterium]|nr:class I SAM-dependent methyltransferase [Candidatus Auribacterota bacterium]
MGCRFEKTVRWNIITSGKSKVVFSGYLKNTIGEAHNILDIGTSQRFNKELREYESWFDGKNYTAAGYNPMMVYGKYNCDRSEDIHNMSFPDESFDAVICIQVLEHVENPFLAAREIIRVLKPGGRLMVTVPFLSFYHGKKQRDHAPDHESYPDLWRFTYQGLEQLFKGISKTETVSLSGPIETRLSFILPERLLDFKFFRGLIDMFDRPRKARSTRRYLLYGVK